MMGTFSLIFNIGTFGVIEGNRKLWSKNHLADTVIVAVIVFPLIVHTTTIG